MKARGLGMALPLDSFELLPGPGFDFHLQVNRDHAAAARWKVLRLDLGADLCVAVAAEGQDWIAVLRGDFSRLTVSPFRTHMP